MSDPWWPPLVDDPAFQVRRQSYGLTVGGDYVRGSNFEIQGTLSGAGTALPASPEVGDTWLLGAPLPTAAPDPPAPGVKTAGQVIRWDGTDWINLGILPTVHQTALRYPTTTPGYEDVVGKAYLTIRWYGHESVSVTLPPDTENLFARIIEQPIGVAEIAWGWPNDLEANWSEVALIRSGFGRPVTVSDGVTVFRALQSSFVTEGVMAPPPIIYDRPLQVGRFFYYSLFFKTTQLDWTLGMSEDVLIPQDYKHADHLWNTIPPYYRYTDDNLRVGSSETRIDGGPLRKFLTLFGWELDHTREFVEQWQNVYNIDKSPMSLLRKVGDNFGVPYKAAAGEVRYRSMLAALPQLLLIRGTTPALKGMIEAGSKWLCDTTIGPNLMLLVDDATFRTGTGNWGTQHTGAGVGWNYLPAPDVFLAAGSGNTPAAPYGEKSMRVTTTKSVSYTVTNKALTTNVATLTVGPHTITVGSKIIVTGVDATFNGTYTVTGVTGTTVLYDKTASNVASIASAGSVANSIQTSNFGISCGCMFRFNEADPPEIIGVYPRTAGIPIHEGFQYGFTIQLYAEAAVDVRIALLWFGKGGYPTTYLSKSEKATEAATVGAWKEYFNQGVAPPGAIYMCPALYFENRAAGPTGRSAFIDLAGAMVYEIDQVSVPKFYIAPDKFLTLGDTEEVLGVETEIGGDEVGGYILGNPRQV